MKIMVIIEDEDLSKCQYGELKWKIQMDGNENERDNCKNTKKPNKCL